MQLIAFDGGFEIRHDTQQLFLHKAGSPAFFVGCGIEKIEMYRGNFDIQDYLESRIALTHARIDGNRIALSTAPDQTALLTATLRIDGDDFTFTFETHDPRLNRFWLRLPAQKQEHVWGCGEQMSYFDLRGRHFPLWTSEPGVGRDKSTEITFKSDVTGKAGGDYYHTNYPQPTFISSRRYAAHIETTAYADFDFRHEHFHELQVWAVPDALEIRSGKTFLDLVSKLSERFGRQPKSVFKVSAL